MINQINFNLRTNNNKSNLQKPKSNVYFGQKFGQLLNQQAAEQGEKMQRALFLKLADYSKSIVQAFRETIKEVFPYIEIDVKDLKEAKKTLKADTASTVLSDINLAEGYPKASVYLDFVRLEKIKENAIDPAKALNETVRNFSKSVLEIYDLSHLEAIVDYFSKNLKQAGSITRDSVDGLIQKTAKSFGIKLDVIVEHVPVSQNEAGLATAYSGIDSDQNVVQKLLADFTQDKSTLEKHVVHEFTHILQFNSPFLQKPLLSMFENWKKPFNFMEYNMRNTFSLFQEKLFPNILAGVDKMIPPEEKEKFLEYAALRLLHEAQAYKICVEYDKSSARQYAVQTYQNFSDFIKPRLP